MSDCAFPIGVSALACAIAEQIQDENELALLAAVLTQLGDTLATIATVRSVSQCMKKDPAESRV